MRPHVTSPLSQLLSWGRGVFVFIRSCVCVCVACLRRRRVLGAARSIGRWSRGASRACVRWWRPAGGACRR
nr:MAG TPA: hypothetical protein [Caudoviricetes sp.]